MSDREILRELLKAAPVGILCLVALWGVFCLLIATVPA